MTKYLMLSMALLLLSGCSNSPADDALARQNFGRLMKQPVQQALDILGPADRIVEKRSGTLYVWSTLGKNAPLNPMPADYDPDSEHHDCILTVLADDEGIIRHGRYQGNYKSCARYDDAINEHFPAAPNGRWINKSYLRRAENGDTN